MKILIDVDGTIADLHTEWLQRYNTDYDDTLTVDKITQWNMEELVKPECGNKIFDYLHHPDLYSRIGFIDGALSSINWLKGHGHQILYVTSGVQESKAKWLYDKGLTTGFWMFAPELIVAHHKHHIKGDLLIDDNPRNCDEFMGKAILFGQPWNDSVLTNHYRASNWPDVIQYIVHYLIERQ